MSEEELKPSIDMREEELKPDTLLREPDIVLYSSNGIRFELWIMDALGSRIIGLYKYYNGGWSLHKSSYFKIENNKLFYKHRHDRNWSTWGDECEKGQVGKEDIMEAAFTLINKTIDDILILE